MPVEIKATVTPYFNLVVSTEDAAGNEKVTAYKLVFDYRAIQRIEEATKLDLKAIETWQNIPSSAIPKIVWGGLARYHKDVAMDEVIDFLNPQAQMKLKEALFDYFFPGVKEEFEKTMKKLQDQATGESPNAPAVPQPTV